MNRSSVSDSFPEDLRIAIFIGRVAGAGAQLDDALTTLAASLAGPSDPPPEDDRGTIPPAKRWAARVARISRKQASQKVELLEILWPDAWDEPKQYFEALQEASRMRNVTAHSHPDWSALQGLEAVIAERVGLPEGVELPMPPVKWGLYDIRARTLRDFQPDQLESIVNFITPLIATTMSLTISAGQNRNGAVSPNRALRWYRENSDAFVQGGGHAVVEMPPDDYV